jgi:hypothetical protein
MPDFDFDTRTPQEPNEPNKLRTLLIATRSRMALITNRVRNHLIASRIVLITNRVRNHLIAHKRRILVIGGGFLLLVVGVPIGLRIYDTTWLGAETVTCDTFTLGKVGSCSPPDSTSYEICKADSREEVDDDTPCKSYPLHSSDDSPQKLTSPLH